MINNPLSSVIRYCQFLVESKGEEQIVESRKVAHVIVNLMMREKIPFDSGVLALYILLYSVSKGVDKSTITWDDIT